MINVLQQQFLYCFTWGSNQRLNLNISFLFLQIFLRLNLLPAFTDNLAWLTCFRVSGCFYCFFGYYECWLPYISRVVQHASRTTTWGTIFTERFFSVSKEWVRSWSHAFLITYHKTLTIKLLVVRQQKVTRGKKTRKAVAELFALNANAKKCS